MVRRIRVRHARQLAGKSKAEIIAFYRAAGEGATDIRRANVQVSVQPANLALEPTAFINLVLSVASGRRGSAQALGGQRLTDAGF
jgi:hypothetical protein